MKTRMNKMLYLKYINDIYQTTDKSYTTEYFDKIKYIINKIPIPFTISRFLSRVNVRKLPPL